MPQLYVQVAKCVEIGLPEIILLLVFSQVIAAVIMHIHTSIAVVAESHELTAFAPLCSIYPMSYMWQSPCSTDLL